MNNKFGNAPAWSIANRHDEKINKKQTGVFVPGPGTYDLRGNPHGIGAKIGTSTRGFNNRQNQPGPGNYNISSKYDGPKISMSTKYGGGIGINSYAPGPGNYNTSENIVRPGSGITIGAKYGSSKILNEEPGPGSYSILDNKKNGVKIGTSKRAGFGGSGNNPGPGQYDYNKRPYSAAPKYGFSKGDRGTFNGQRAPGPGQYQINSFIKTGQHVGCTIGSRFKKGFQTADLGPGPGYYDSEIKKHASGAKIGKAKRGILGDGMTPGPGAYDSGYKSQHGGTKIGSSKRGQFGRAQTPGPGSYDTLNQSKGGVTISGHRGHSRIDYIPGPGAYNPDDFNKGRPCSANMGRSNRAQMSKADTPGPGQYYHDQSHHYKFAHTNQLRSKQLKKGDPGPGQYQIPSSVPSAPHYLIDPNIYKQSYASGISRGSRS